jgi:hypothetical protein
MKTKLFRGGATYLKVPDPVWNKLSLAERWEMNRAYLDDINENQNEIIFMDWERKYSFYARELWYLRNKGIDVSGVQTTWGD